MLFISLPENASSDQPHRHNMARWYNFDVLELSICNLHQSKNLSSSMEFLFPYTTTSPYHYPNDSIQLAIQFISIISLHLTWKKQCHKWNFAIFHRQNNTKLIINTKRCNFDCHISSTVFLEKTMWHSISKKGTSQAAKKIPIVLEQKQKGPPKTWKKKSRTHQGGASVRCVEARARRFRHRQQDMLAGGHQIYL